MTQQVEALTAKHDELSLISRTDIGKEKLTCANRRLTSTQVL